MSERWFMQGAARLADAIRDREVSSRELLDTFLSRVERLDGEVNAVVTLDAERARAQADEADAATARDESFGPLHGVPVTIKDSLETARLRTASGHEPLTNHVPEVNAVAVQRLVEAGAIVFGKTNLPELAGDAQTYNPIFGVTRNPWDLARTPGGSSGGSAAALAAGLTGLELGSDIAGSVRHPANWCGVYAHKPTHGIIPNRGHIPGPPGALSEVDLAVLGPMARAPEDLELALDVMMGPLPDRATAWSLALPSARHEELADYRVAVWLDDAACPVDDEVKACLGRTVDTLRAAGVTVREDVRPPIALGDLVRTYQQLLFPLFLAGVPEEAIANLRDVAASLPDDDSPAARMARFALLSHREWLAAHEERERIRRLCAVWFRDVDVLLCPVDPCVAIPHDHREPLAIRTITVNGAERPYMDVVGWIALATMAHLPATVAPVGLTPGGLPVGVQIVGPYLEDRTPLGFAGHLADLLGPAPLPPAFAGD
jgi:amidase